jgi:hypothetical protein
MKGMLEKLLEMAGDGDGMFDPGQAIQVQTVLHGVLIKAGVLHPLSSMSGLQLVAAGDEYINADLDPDPKTVWTVWIVGRVLGEANENGLCDTWGFDGVFESEKEAGDYCTSIHQFIGPATLNEYLGGELFAWPGCYYPLIERWKANEEESTY